MAGIAGFLLGPMLGVFITRVAAQLSSRAAPAGSVAMPLAVTALLAFLVACVIAIAVPRGEGRQRSHETKGVTGDRPGWLVARMLVLTFIVSAGVGVFEIGLALRGKLELGLTAYQIALMFTECSVVMFVVQAMVFSPWFKPDLTRWLIAPGLLVLTTGLFLVPWASTFTEMLVAIGAVAASAGILSPILTYWISAKAANAQGWELGKQTAAASLGVTVGSVAGGFLFDVALLRGAPFFLTAGLTLVGLLLSLRLPRRLGLAPLSSRTHPPAD
jgi:predicted MFS family arabinose efflux permease